jgi:N-acetylmuramoyl-L-alanine amidase
VREIKRIVLHCAATKPSQDIDADTIREWHLARGWSDIGYHYVIKLDGIVESGRPLSLMGAHARGHNKNSVGICYIGGLDYKGKPQDTMNGRQVDSFKRLVYALCITLNKPLAIHGHNEFSDKACPSFKVADKFSELQSWALSYQRRFADQRPPAALELTQHSTGHPCPCCDGKCGC